MHDIEKVEKKKKKKEKEKEKEKKKKNKKKKTKKKKKHLCRWSSGRGIMGSPAAPRVPEYQRDMLILSFSPSSPPP